MKTKRSVMELKESETKLNGIELKKVIGGVHQLDIHGRGLRGRGAEEGERTASLEAVVGGGGMCRRTHRCGKGCRERENTCGCVNVVGSAECALT